jgi:RNA polymerase sigma-70 factor (ECF subfamily)
MGKRTGAATLESTPEPSDEFDRLRRKLLQAIRHYSRGWLAEASEDLVQIALIRVLEARRNRSDAARLPATYLYKAAYTALVNEIRRRRRRPEVQLDPTFDPPAAGPSTDDSPERALSARELGEAIRQCLDRAVRDRKLAVTLHLQGYSNREAARTLGFDQKRTENLVYRGLEDLRRCLSAQGIAA